MTSVCVWGWGAWRKRKKVVVACSKADGFIAFVVTLGHRARDDHYSLLQGWGSCLGEALPCLGSLVQ
jgi:hypothetical protein